MNRQCLILCLERTSSLSSLRARILLIVCPRRSGALLPKIRDLSLLLLELLLYALFASLETVARLLAGVLAYLLAEVLRERLHAKSYSFLLADVRSK